MKGRALVTGAEQGLGREISNQLTAMGYSVDHMTGCRFVFKNRVFDVIINNQGFNYLSHIGTEPDCGEEILIKNVLFGYRTISNLIEAGHPPAKVINVSSITHRVSQRCTSLYCASKAAVVQMTRVMARELAPKGWQINCYAPGKILDTEMTRKTDAQVLELRGWTKEEADDYALSNVPVGRFMTVQEAAANCLVILQFSHYVNGACIEASGGQ